MTDFPRYLEFTGQVLEDVVSRANALYREACRLGDEGRRIDAIRLYDEVIMMFPPFYEAIDNRAFTFMELGDYQTALAGFDMSLDVHPHGFAAFFSRGECLMRLGQLEKAQAVFEEGLTRFPEQRETLERFLRAVREVKGAK